jgi:hypothetical protein
MSAIDPDSPLRLADAVSIAFPAGGMTMSGLRGSCWKPLPASSL